MLLHLHYMINWRTPITWMIFFLFFGLSCLCNTHFMQSGNVWHIEILLIFIKNLISDLFNGYRHLRRTKRSNRSLIVSFDSNQRKIDNFLHIMLFYLSHLCESTQNRDACSVHLSLCYAHTLCVSFSFSPTTFIIQKRRLKQMWESDILLLCILNG